MPANYVLLQRVELNASAASVTFSNIPQSGYTDLKIVVSARTDQSGVNRSFKVQPNGVDITARKLGAEGNPLTAYSDTGIGIYAVGSGATSSTFDNAEIYITNYNSTSTYKSLSIDTVNENNGTDSGLSLSAGLYSSNTAISSVTLIPAAGSFVQYSTFSLYGLAAVGTTPVIAPKATGGNITTDGTYWYHTFLSTGAFVPATSINADVLVIAGGGGGGSGGAGAGGLLYFASQALSPNSYTTTVGAGGAKAASYGAAGSNGVASQFGSLTTTVGGGGGGGAEANNAASGGSGGGGGSWGTTTTTGGAGTSGQGSTGGGNGGYTGSPYPSGGGGGKGGTGGLATSNTVAGIGGAGVSTYSAWASATSTGVSGAYAGGGGGGIYLTGGTAGTATAGGGAGSINDATATSGTANTGGGGGGSGQGRNGGAGGSGIVIVRYTVA